MSSWRSKITAATRCHQPHIRANRWHRMPARHERQADVRSSARRRRHATWHRYADGVADAQAVAVGQNDLDGLRASGAFGQWWRFHFVRLCWCCIDHAHWHKRRRRSRTEPALVHLTPQGDRISKQCEQLGGKAVIAPRARELAAQGVLGAVLLRGLDPAAARVGWEQLKAKRGRQWGIGASSSRGDSSLPR